KLAKLAEQLAIVRSYVPGDANHDIKPVVCKDSFGGNLGSAYASVAGTNHPATGMPTNLVLFPRAVDSSTQEGTKNFGHPALPGPFGGAPAPFVPGSGGSLQKDMKLTLPMDRLDDRRALLRGLDGLKEALDEGQRVGADSMRDKAFSILLGGVG